MKFKQSLLVICLAATFIVTSASAATAVVTKVNINKADAKALMGVQGMSAYKAHNIVAYRHKNGEFKNLSELDKVKGFKKMTPESMKLITDRLGVEG